MAAGYDRLDEIRALGRSLDPEGRDNVSASVGEGRRPVRRPSFEGGGNSRLMIGSTRTTEPKTEKGIDDYVSPHLDRGDRHVSPRGVRRTS